MAKGVVLLSKNVPRSLVQPYYCKGKPKPGPFRGRGGGGVKGAICPGPPVSGGPQI